jgi:hypothetical protein
MLNIIWAIIGDWLAAVFGVRFTGGIDWIRHILQIGAAAVLIAIIAPMWMRRGAGRGMRPAVGARAAVGAVARISSPSARAPTRGPTVAGLMP